MTSKRKEEKGKQGDRENEDSSGEANKSGRTAEKIKEEMSKWQGQWLGGEVE